jgi:hypothetical protein
MTKADLIETLGAGKRQDMLTKQVVAKIGAPRDVVPQAA